MVNVGSHTQWLWWCAQELFECTLAYNVSSGRGSGVRPTAKSLTGVAVMSQVLLFNISVPVNWAELGCNGGETNREDRLEGWAVLWFAVVILLILHLLQR